MLGHFSEALADGEHEPGALRVYSLDRISELKATSFHFVMDPDFSPADYFADCYGVTVGDGTRPQRVVVRTLPWLSYYLNDLPLHHSQREIGRCDEYTDFELFIRPTRDFVNHLIGWGDAVKVLEPESLVETVREKLRRALRQYET